MENGIRELTGGRSTISSMELAVTVSAKWPKVHGSHWREAYQDHTKMELFDSGDVKLSKTAMICAQRSCPEPGSQLGGATKNRHSTIICHLHLQACLESNLLIGL